MTSKFLTILGYYGKKANTNRPMPNGQELIPCVQDKANDRGPTADNRMFIEAVLWIARTGSPWAGFTQGIWQMEQRVPALPPLGQSRALYQNL